ncbi:uncharacterized protein LOC143878594 [Tasmannia lanceolata]|uniref:uncharacterized protein LOC143878594 n=1 Tax=Tasmannia lanceolata TaxID=3420 RepID=UPI004062BA1B
MEESGSTKEITEEEVIGKLKDDGDFDNLRLKIIRKLKDNEDLRNSIISAVKHSEVLNRQGAENLKPRQLSDAIHEEIGSKVMSQISDAVWDIIRSGDGMKNEITETVESVYNKFLNPKGKEVQDDLPLPTNQPLSEMGANVSLTVSPCDRNPTCVIEPNEPSGFSLSNCPQADGSREEDKVSSHDQSHEEQKEPCDPPDVGHLSDGEPPGFAVALVHNEQKDDGSDEDPDVPPGFG